MANETTFTLTFKTIAQLTGLDQLMNGVQNGVRQIEGINAKLQSLASTANTILTAAGSYLAISKLEEYAHKAQDASEQQAAWTNQILRGKDGSRELVDELNKYNAELAETTATSVVTSRAVERQLSLFGATGKQIKDLTKGIIEFGAARGMQPEELTNWIARSLGKDDISLARIGIVLDRTKTRAEQIQQLIDQLLKGGGNTAEVMKQASGYVSEFGLSWEQLKIAIGNVVNLVRVPFLSALTAGMEGLKGKLNDSTSALGGWSEQIYVAAGVAGHWVGKNIQLIGSISALGGSLLLLRTFIGLIGPQATAAVGGIIILSAGYSVLTEKILGVPLTITEAYGIAFRQTEVVWSALKEIILAMVKVVTGGVDLLVAEALTKLIELAQAAASILSTLSLGAVKIDTSALDAKLTELKGRTKQAAEDVSTGTKSMLQTAADANLQIYREFQEKLAEIKKKGGDTTELKKQLHEFFRNGKQRLTSSRMLPARA